MPNQIGEQPKRRRPPATTPEARINQVIALAYDLAEKQLSDGTASSQVITQFLKMGTAREKKEVEILEHQKELMKAKTEAIKSTKTQEELYKNALRAMATYSGQRRDDDNDYDCD